LSTPGSAREPRLALAARRPPGASPWKVFTHWLKQEVVTAPLVPVLHTSPLRMKGLGLFTLVGHPLFWFVWAVWLPQPYENLPLRLFTASLGFLLMSQPVSSDPSSRLAGQVFSAVFWFELPFLFSFLFFCNGGNGVWMASMAAMILSYYFTTDWRLATVGVALGLGLGRAAFLAFGPDVAPMTSEVVWTNVMVLAFCVSMGILLGLSSANLRREQLEHTLMTMGIMAHELRTPLATMALIGDAVRGSAAEGGPETRDRLEELAGRLHTLVRNMNHQIDMQISNARLLRLPEVRESVSAGDLVTTAVTQYPFRSHRERETVQVRVQEDFRFTGSQALFLQVIDNMMKNALRSLAAGGSPPRPGDLTVEVLRESGRGRIVIADKGVGIGPELQARIFEPFFSTNRGTGHGLGLALCHRVVQAAGGTLRVRSEPGQGATFTIELPVRP
jgi:two-component system CAI-1 autoinducer sensor kinase/phosphatase CqsS